jgi:predicted Zn-dependent protease with MMP-like domain
MKRLNLSSTEFDQLVEAAVRRLPAEFRRHLKNLVITVEKRPSPGLLEEMGLPPNQPLLGLYQGVPLTERSAVDPPLYPDSIVLFQEPLESFCRDGGELEAEIEITLAHEIAHYLGIDEARLEELGYA